MALFCPTLYRRRVTDITIEDLRVLGVRGLFLDVDNTLTTHSSQVLEPAVAAWLASMKEAGIALTVVSNSWEWRVAPFAEKIGLRHLSLSCKPSPLGFWRAARRLGLPLSQCAAVGDQVFTDMLGAKLGGVSCILLDPIDRDCESGKPFLLLRRRWEAPLREKWKAREADV